MSITYFRPRDRFDFTKATLDIGNPVTWKRTHFLKHLFKRVFAIDEARIEEFYQRHLAFYLENHPLITGTAIYALSLLLWYAERKGEATQIRYAALYYIYGKPGALFFIDR